MGLIKIKVLAKLLRTTVFFCKQTAKINTDASTEFNRKRTFPVFKKSVDSSRPGAQGGALAPPWDFDT
jgi:hypothetical protein